MIAYALYFLIGVLGFIILIKLFTGPLKLIAKLLINGVIGVILLFITNLIGSYFGIQIGINLVTALIAGICGIPGVIFLVIFKLLF